MKEMRADWKQEMMAPDAESARYVFIDETAIQTDMNPSYARALGGARANDAVPARQWRTLTLLGAISVNGFVAAMTIESPTDTDVYEAFAQHVLCPNLKPGDIVIADNFPPHKAEEVCNHIRATGATVRFLPPYSPDFNPIEPCWAQIKQYLRALKARTVAALESAVRPAIQQVTSKHIAAYYTDCGYYL